MERPPFKPHDEPDVEPAVDRDELLHDDADKPDLAHASDADIVERAVRAMPPFMQAIWRRQALEIAELPGFEELVTDSYERERTMRLVDELAGLDVDPEQLRQAELELSAREDELSDAS